MLLHDLPATEAAIERARDLLDEVADPDVVAQGAWTRAAALAVVGWPKQSQTVLAEAGSATAAARPDLQAANAILLTLLATWRGDYRTVPTDEADPRADGLAPLDQAGFSTWTRMLGLIGRGDIEEAIAEGEASLERLTRVNESWYRPRILNTIGWANYEVLDLDEAERWNRRSLELAQEIDLPDPEIESNARLNLADIELERGDLERARTQLDWVGSVVTDPGPSDWFGLWRYTMHWRADTIRMSLLEGDLDLAAREAQRLIDDAEENGSRKYEAIGLRLAAETARLAGDHATARTAIGQATDVAEAIGSPTQRWNCYAEGAALARALGDQLAAADLTRQATELIGTIAAGLRPERRARFLAADRVNALTNSMPQDHSAPP